MNQKYQDHQELAPNNEQKLSWKRFILPVIILTVAALITIRIVKTTPKAQRVAQKIKKTYVEVESAQSISTNVILNLMGIVEPTTEVIVKSRVSGEVIFISPKLKEGGHFKKGETMLQIDPRDYKFEIVNNQAKHAQAEHDFKLEQGEQEMGKYYWNLMDKSETNSSLQSDLTLRKPQYKRAQANLASAQADLDKAELNLERTTIKAPFESVVLSENIDLGAQVTINSEIAKLAGTEEYTVTASIPLDRIKWLYDPNKSIKGRTAKVQYPNGEAGTSSWNAVVSHYRGELVSNGRMGQICLSVSDPFSKKNPDDNRLPLLLNSYVDVEIMGQKLENVYALSRTALREDDTIWLVGPDGKLIVRPVDIVWRDRKMVYLEEGLKDGDLVIVSDLSTPVAGMLLEPKLLPQDK